MVALAPGLERLISRCRDLDLKGSQLGDQHFPHWQRSDLNQHSRFGSTLTLRAGFARNPGHRSRRVLYGSAANAAEQRRQAAAVTRHLALLRAHRLIVRVPKTHRDHRSASGRRILTALLAAHASDVRRLTQAA
jgi:hypothetical protein